MLETVFGGPSPEAPAFTPPSTCPPHSPRLALRPLPTGNWAHSALLEIKPTREGDGVTRRRVWNTREGKQGSCSGCLPCLPLLTPWSHPVLTGAPQLHPATVGMSIWSPRVARALAPQPGSSSRPQLLGSHLWAMSSANQQQPPRVPGAQALEWAELRSKSGPSPAGRVAKLLILRELAFLRQSCGHPSRARLTVTNITCAAHLAWCRAHSGRSHITGIPLLSPRHYKFLQHMSCDIQLCTYITCKKSPQSTLNSHSFNGTDMMNPYQSTKTPKALT